MSERAAIDIALLQINPVMGDIDGNARRVAEAVERLRASAPFRVALLSELVLVGYPPDDLVLRPDLPELVERALAWLAARLATSGVAVVVGAPVATADGLQNAAVVLDGGERLSSVGKRCLPNYGVFDEKRHFSPGEVAGTVTIDGRRLGILVCEDLWSPEPAADLRAAGAEVLLCPNASPFHRQKPALRRTVAAQRCAETGLPVIYVNQFGGQDDLVFDGDSFALDAGGGEVLRLPACEAASGVVRLQSDGRLAARGAAPAPPPADETGAVYGALRLAVADYIDKNGFAGVFVGLSGGIDSALTLALAVDALGPERVTAVLMPSRHTAPMSLEDAAAEADTLGVQRLTLPIEGPYAAFLDCLAEPFSDREPDVTEENLQARCRGVLLMALSNKYNRLVLSTGNKSEMAVGYATLYGDMAGGFAPLKDVPKTLVYELARWRNRQSHVIPTRTLERPPSAELAPDQLDTDNLPPYEELDPILEALVERDDRVEDIVAAGHDEETVRRVARMLVRSEYKRRQAAPGPKVTARAFGRERRYPITSRYPF
ncbi:MAG: NAD+ synthase [Halofilum sp. (in: g-proteobacteria)]|nr:NAD+ synthase [Halofilum sp. (in: g-proteobacteria)]